jgi:hypothetical protein
LLRRRDDFMTAAMIAEALGKEHVGKIANTLNELRGYRAVDCLKQGQRLWWFARPPEEDTRSRVYEERTPESRPRKRPLKAPPA